MTAILLEQIDSKTRIELKNFTRGDGEAEEK
jgi:hypothetical protein